jgi:transcriptional regulator with XRE-family HTH domain
MTTPVSLIIRQRRRAAALSQTELAERAGLSQTWISRLERGEENPTLSTLEALARGFGITLSELFATDAEAA